MGGSTESAPINTEPLIRAEQLSMRNGIFDVQRHGTTVVISPDRRLAAFTDNLGRVAVLDITKGYIIRLLKGCRDAQCAFVQVHILSYYMFNLLFVFVSVLTKIRQNQFNFFLFV